jgi:hypothetical protein
MDNVLIFDVSVEHADEMKKFLFENEIGFSATFIGDVPENCFRFRIIEGRR